MLIGRLALGALALLQVACQAGPPSAAPGGSAPAAAAPVAPGAPAARTTERATEVERLVAAAQAAGETELNLTWSQNSLGGNAGAARWEALFNRLYGTQIRINFTPGPSMTDMAGKISQEAATGRKASTDVLLGAESHIGPLVDLNVLESYDYTQLGSRIRPEFVAPGNVAVEFTSRLPGITYNTDLVAAAEVPRALEDTLDPKWKGRIASTVNAASFDRVASRPEWGVEKMTAFVSRLSENVAGLMRCGENPRIMSGEFVMLVMDCGSYDANRNRAAGAPLGHVIPENAATVLFFYMGVPRTSAHPNLAKLYVNMLLSEEGQRLLYEIEWTDHYALPGSQSANELSGLRAKGIEPLRMDARFVAEHPDTVKLGDELTRILREKH
jgi:ABC-type Fe3+ transport system substrate-binding protein